MFPYKDDNPTLATPAVTLLLIATNVIVWVLIQGMGAEPTLTRSVCVLGEERTWFTPLSSMFLHGGWFHLIGNMWFLWVFGNNVEDSMGHIRYLAFYLLCGLAAAAAQTYMNPSSPIPMVGASGAISGVMGAYIVLYPKVRVHMLVILGFFITRIVVPAYLMLGYWFVIQLLGGSLSGEQGGVAFWAHAGGFIAGAILIHLFRDPELVAKHRAMSKTVDRLAYREE
jgi:membrane associated rhomboid family serine protease